MTHDMTHDFCSMVDTTDVMSMYMTPTTYVREVE